MLYNGKETIMSKTVNLKNIKGDIDKKFERLSPSAARQIDNGGTKAKKTSKPKK